jgi:hypothetical protein
MRTAGSARAIPAKARATGDGAGSVGTANATLNVTAGSSGNR